MKRHDFGNAYEVVLPVDLNISPVFNISDLKKYYEGGYSDEVANIQWSISAATSDTKEVEEILDSHIGRSTRTKPIKSTWSSGKGDQLKIHHG